MTITHDDIYKRFLIEYDKANITSSYPSLTVYEAVAILNKAYVALISQKLTGNNPRRASFEADLKAIEDLQPLIKTSGPHTVQQYIFGAENEYIIEYPLDMMYYLQSFLRGSDNKTHNTNLITHQSALEFKKTAINTPWIEQPVVYMENNLIHTLVDDSVDTELLNAYITYIKTPEWFEVELVEGYEEDPSEWYPTTPQQQNPFILAEEGRVAAEEARVLAESERQDSEETRQLAEQQRTSAEEQRDTAESLRITAETLRDDEETLRNSAELQRKNSEQTRISYEENRELAEQARSASELGRVTAELSRATAEVERNTAENSRATAELSRQTLESNRANAEGQRASAEISRIATEENRNSAELSRVANESSRVLAELARVSAENQRVAAEQLRLAAVTVAQQDIEDLLENKADVNGYYETLGAGVATNLRGGLIHDHQFTYRKTGGNEEVLSDLAYVTKIKGNTVAWNQLVVDGGEAKTKEVASYGEITYFLGGNVTQIVGHVYYISAVINTLSEYFLLSLEGEADLLFTGTGSPKRFSGIKTSTTAASSMYIGRMRIVNTSSSTTFATNNVFVIDLTLMFGAGNEPSTVEEFEAWLATNVGLKDYYEYCSGKLVSFGGTTVKMNQLVQNGNFEDDSKWTDAGVSISVDNNVVSVTAASNGDNYVQQVVPMTIGHKYYFSGWANTPNSNVDLFYLYFGEAGNVKTFSASQVNTWIHYEDIFTCVANTYNTIRLQNGVGDTTNMYRNCYLIDLTLMFGAGNEPTKEWCDEHFTADYYPYHTGYETNLLNITGQQTGLKSVGFNLWDEEWEAAYYNNGVKVYDSGNVCCKEPIKVMPNTLYYIKLPVNGQLQALNDNKEFIGNLIVWGSSQEFRTPTNCYYLAFFYNASTYNHDVCINISDPSKNGTYEPYLEDTIDMSWVRTLGIENFNIWDEEWEEGTYNDNTGSKITYSNRIRNKNLIPVSSNTQYYGLNGVSGGNMMFLWYDKNGTFISSSWATNTTVTSPSNAAYLNFYIGSAEQTTYNHNVCINKSIAHFNGRYYPYGETAPYFPNGLCKAGSVYDEVRVEGDKIKGVVRIGSVDLGDLDYSYDAQTHILYTPPIISMATTENIVNPVYVKMPSVYDSRWDTQPDKSIWCYYSDTRSIRIKDESYSSKADFVNGIKGIIFYYELETPYEFEIENIYLPPLKVDNGGTEQILPDNSSNVITCAPILSIMYGLNAAETLKSLPTNYISVLSLDSLIGCIQSALDINITKTWEPGLNRYVFTFEQNELQTEPGAGE